MLYLLRHAKSCWADPSLVDRERGLNQRGRRDAANMGRALAQRLEPAPVVVSPAMRARLTLELICGQWPQLARQPHQVSEQLYTFDASDLLQWLAPQQQQRLFLIGHNPAFTELVNLLCQNHQLENLPTAGYIALQLPVANWGDLLTTPATVVDQLFPKQLL